MSEGRRTWMSQFKQKSKFTLPPPFLSMQALKRLDFFSVY